MSEKKKTYSFFGYFRYFRELLGRHIYVFIILNFFIGLLDGIGLTMFIPLLSAATEDSNVEDSLGQLAIGINALKNIGIKFNITNMLLIMIFLFSMKGLINYLKDIYTTRITTRATQILRFKLIDNLQNISYQGFTKMSVGTIQNHIFGESNRLIGAMSLYVGSIQFTTMLLTYLALAILSNWQFAIMVAIGGFLTDFIFKYLSNLIKELSRKQINLGNNFNDILIQSVNNFKYLKATNNIEKYNTILKENIKLNNKFSIKSARLGGIMKNLREPLIISIISLVIIVQISVLGSGLSSIMVSLLLFYRCLGYLMNLQGSINNFIVQATAIESIDNILEEFKNNKEPNNSETISKIGNIEVKNLDITFGKTPILKNINFNIKPKTSIAFVGESGAGKTTLANVICGLQIPHNGQIIIDHQSLYDSNLKSYRNKIGYITQEAVIFNDTLFNNITFWDEKTPENLEKFYKVMEMVSLHDFVDKLEEKENSTLGNNGVLVSGGQKQRISIARELYKDVELLIMDEATSALDSETEKHIKESIDVLQGKFTIIIIAHRLSTIKNVDEIFLMDKGEVLASGNFNELVQKSERFKKMVELQEV